MAAPLRSLPGHAQTGPVIAGLVAIGGFCGAAMWAMGWTTYDTWAALLIGAAILLVCVPLLWRLTREDSAWLRQVMICALVMKLVGSLVRYFTIFEVYDGTADAASYDNHGWALAQQYARNVFTTDTGRGGPTGTGFIIIVTAVVYLFVGHTLTGAFLVFATLAFWGTYWLYRAFELGVPRADHRRYAVLLFFLPSMLFWPSSVGKDAWTIAWLGLCAYGGARLYAHHRGGIALLFVGLVAIGVVRPHISLMVFAGVFVGFMLSAPRRRTLVTPLLKIGSIVLLAGVGFILVQNTASFLGVKGDLSADVVRDTANSIQERTTGGGSAFTARQVRGPQDLPYATATVLFRPFPWEADTATAFVSSAEAVTLMAILVLSWRRLAQVPRLITRNPYLALCGAYLLLFVVAFSTFGNFGILARERVQALPFLLVFAALPKVVTPQRHVPTRGYLERTAR